MVVRIGFQQYFDVVYFIRAMYVLNKFAYFVQFGIGAETYLDLLLPDTFLIISCLIPTNTSELSRMCRQFTGFFFTVKGIKQILNLIFTFKKNQLVCYTFTRCTKTRYNLCTYVSMDMHNKTCVISSRYEYIINFKKSN